MQQSTSEADGCCARQDISLLVETYDLLLCSLKPPNGLYSESITPIPHLHILFI